MENTKQEDFEEFVYLAWMIWGKRCSTVHNRDHEENRDVYINASCFLKNYHHALKECSKSRITPPVCLPSLWVSPPIGHICFDVDASFRDVDDRCGIGGVLRNHEGQLIAAFGLVIAKPDSIFVGATSNSRGHPFYTRGRVSSCDYCVRLTFDGAKEVIK